MSEYGTFDSSDMDVMNDAIHKYKLSLCLLFSCSLGARNRICLIKPSEDLNNMVEKIVGQAKNQDRLLSSKDSRRLFQCPLIPSFVSANTGKPKASRGAEK